jgi:hypothetical protein
MRFASCTATLSNLTMQFEYFSDRENGPRPRIGQAIDPAAWAGLAALVDVRVKRGAFGHRFPLICPDGNEVYGTDEQQFAAALRAEVPGLEWPPVTSRRDESDFMSQMKPYAPPTLQVLDFLQFCWYHVSRPYESARHEYFKHTHLRFDEQAGRDDFRIDVNRILARNGLAYEMQQDGSFIRLAPPVLDSAIRAGFLRSGDHVLDVMLEECRLKFLSPDPLVRREGLERLFDSFERLKSIPNPTDKAASTRMLLARVSPEPAFRAALEAEALALRNIGNGQLFRHHETMQNVLVDVDQIDHVFHRLWALVALLVKKGLS